MLGVVVGFGVDAVVHAWRRVSGTPRSLSAQWSDLIVVDRVALLSPRVTTALTPNGKHPLGVQNTTDLAVDLCAVLGEGVEIFQATYLG